MSALAFGLGVAFVALAGVLRFGGSSLLRTPRADALRDAAEGVPGAARVADLLEETSRVQPSLGAVHSAILVASAIPTAWSIAASVSGSMLAPALVGLGVVLVFLGDTFPRSLGRSRPRGPAYRLSWLLGAAVSVGRRTADLLVDDEPTNALDAQADAIESEEMELISSVLEFTDAIVREVMVPRTDMVTVAASDDTDHALDVILEHGRSRVPVTGDDLDDIVGVLYARDLLTLYDSGGGPRSVTKLMRPVHFVPETKRVSELLRELQASKVHLAVVVNEFGSTAGLVTIEDILEEIVGEIVDEYDDELPMVEAMAGGVYVVDARLSVDDLGQVVGHELPNGDWDTVGGLVLALAGRVPEEGESFEVEGLTVTVERVQGRRVAQVRVTTT